MDRVHQPHNVSGKYSDDVLNPLKLLKKVFRLVDFHRGGHALVFISHLRDHMLQGVLLQAGVSVNTCHNFGIGLPDTCVKCRAFTSVFLVYYRYPGIVFVLPYLFKGFIRAAIVNNDNLVLLLRIVYIKGRLNRHLNSIFFVVGWYNQRKCRQFLH